MSWCLVKRRYFTFTLLSEFYHCLCT